MISLLESKNPELAYAEKMLDQAFGTSDASLNHVFVPYRIRPLGAHLDHQGGPVLSLNTRLGIHGFWRFNGKRKVRVLSEGIGQTTIVLGQPIRLENDAFDYLRGTCSQAVSNGFDVKGIDVFVLGELTACGLSSSAAVTLLYQELLCSSVPMSLSMEERLDWAVDCENHFIGVQSGIGDQTSMLFGREREAVHYECRDRKATNIYQHAPWTFLVVNSGQSAPLAGSSAFNDRVAESYAAAEELGRLSNRLTASPRLSDFDESSFRQYWSGLTSISQRRGEHYFTEAERVRLGVSAWKADDPDRFGQLMNASCQSSIQNYETGTPALIELVELLQQQRGVFGARFSGAGTRGCVVALVAPTEVDSILEELPKRYSKTLAELVPDQWAFTTTAGIGITSL